MPQPEITVIANASGALSRDDARAMFAASLDYSILTAANMQRLRTLINQCMVKSGVMDGSYRCRQRAIVRPNYASITCKSYYFDGREVITFNRDGFVGFAGWADDRNVQPILEGFKVWVEEMSAASEKNAA